MSEQQESQSQTATESAGSIPPALRKLVDRPVMKDGKVVMNGSEPKTREIQLKEVVSWKEYADRVVIVTDDGQKFTGEKK